MLIVNPIQSGRTEWETQRKSKVDGFLFCPPDGALREPLTAYCRLPRAQTLRLLHRRSNVTSVVIFSQSLAASRLHLSNHLPVLQKANDESAVVVTLQMFFSYSSASAH